MSVESLDSLRSKIIFFLRETFRTTTNSAGWGLTKTERNPISITNTGEALLICSHLNAIDEVLSDNSRTSVIRYLSAELEKAFSAPQVRTRDIAFASLSLHLLNEDTHSRAAIERLNGLANAAGWPVSSRVSESSLVSTVHAINALKALGAPIEDKHYHWVKQLKKPDDLYGFGVHDEISDFGASCIALYILSQSPEKKESWVNSLAKAVTRAFPDILSRISRCDFDWVGRDPHTDFKILGYGHGSMALHECSTDLFDVGIDSLLSSQQSKENRTGSARFDPFLLNPEKTWLPAVLEIVLALAAIRANFDPLRHYDMIKDRVNRSLTLESESEKARLAAEWERLSRREAIIDELHKGLILSRLGLHQMRNDIVQSSQATIKSEFAMEHMNRRQWYRSWVTFIGLTMLVVISSTSLLLIKLFSGGMKFSDVKDWLYMLFGVAVSGLIVPIWKKTIGKKTNRVKDGN